jgi:hypothetical protein
VPRHQGRTGRHDRRISKRAAVILSWLLWLAAYVILCAGAGGEIAAVLTLYEGREDGSKLFVLLATLALVITAAAGPFARFVVAGFDIQVKAPRGVGRSAE